MKDEKDMTDEEWLDHMKRMRRTRLVNRLFLGGPADKRWMPVRADALAHQVGSIKEFRRAPFGQVSGAMVQQVTTYRGIGFRRGSWPDSRDDTVIFLAPGFTDEEAMKFMEENPHIHR